MLNTAYWLNTAWMATCAAEARRFDRATMRVGTEQERLLNCIVRANRDCWYGKQFDFAKLRSVEDFQRAVPVCRYDDLRSPLERIASGEGRVLTGRPVTLFEPTGGTAGGEKLIPYTHALRRQFQRAVSTWVYDVMKYIPAVRQGPAYWSISPPPLRAKRTSGGIPIGFQEDRDYLASWQRWTVAQLLVAPPILRTMSHIENARYLTLLAMLAEPRLALISVWSPTFLTTLLEDLPRYSPRLCDDLHDGKVRLPRTDGEVDVSQVRIARNMERADALRGLTVDADDPGGWLPSVWPQLALVSCWADASSATFVPRLRQLLPHARIQPKGLLATEGIVSFPLTAAGGCVLAVRSHFFEFLEVDEYEETKVSAAPRLAEQLETNRRYRVILTTGGGLYRYDIGDVIEVVGQYRQCPIVRFIGRTALVSDLVGEKLHETHVRESIERACRDCRISAVFAMLAPVMNHSPGYCLYLEAEHPLDSERSLALEQQLDELLSINPQYRIAVESRQLLPVTVRLTRKGAAQRYQQRRMEQGQRLGDIKFMALDGKADWSGLE
ncbi:MAG: GH3 auxin-responsive promoter family protein [Pirellulaceae bacterium]|nr:GH3 auxin-responsive promoter family protein [Planctomycetales bacterium]